MAATAKNSYSARRRQFITSMALVFIIAASTMWGMAQLPWFKSMMESKDKNPYDLSALQKMKPEERDKQVETWVQNWKDASEDEKKKQADQYLDAIVDYTAKQLGFNQSQKVELRSLTKGAALLATELKINEKEAPERQKIAQELRQQVMEQLDQILSPDQKQKLQALIEERNRNAPRYQPLRDGPPDDRKGQ